MLDHYELDLSPENSRLLIKFLDLANLPYPDELKEISGGNLVTQAQLNDFVYQLDGKHLKVLQHITDHQGRALIADGGYMQSRVCSLAWVWMNNLFPLVICCQDEFETWRLICSKIWGDSRNISVSKDGKIDINADIIITKLSEFINSVEYMTYKRPKQFIFENIGSGYASKSASIAKGLSSEVFQSLFIVNIQSISKDKKKSLKEIFDSITASYGELSNMIDNFLSNDAILKTNVFDENMKKYLIDRGYGYSNSNRTQIMNLLGLNFDLIQDVENANTFK